MGSELWKDGRGAKRARSREDASGDPHSSRQPPANLTRTSGFIPVTCKHFTLISHSEEH